MRDSWLLLKSDSISWRKALKNSHNSQIQWLVVNAPCQETKKLLNRKVGFEGTPRLDPHWKLQPVAYKVKKEWKSLNKDSSHSWVRILMASTNWSQTWTTRKRRQRAETSEMQFEDCTLKLNTCDFASRSKAKAKPEGRNSVNPSTRTIHIDERTWTDIQPQKHSLSDYSVSKKLITLLRHGSLHRENDGIEFWRIKDHLQDHFVYAHHWADEEWKSSMARRRGNKKRFQNWKRFFKSNSVPPSSPRSFRTHSCWSFITRQCRDSGRFLEVYLSRWTCNQFTFHHQFRIDTRMSKFEQPTNSILSACGSQG